MLERLASDDDFNVSVADLESVLEPMRFVGRAPQQVDEFLDEVVAPLLARSAGQSDLGDEVRV
jgi:adenylosuccinate lyase